MRGLQYVLDIIDKGFGVGIRKAKQQTQGLDDAINKTNGNIAKIKVTGQQSFDGLGSVIKKVGLAIIAAFSIGAVINFGNEVTNLTAKFEGFTNAIEFASGQEGGKNIQFLDDTIKRLNLDMESSYKGFQTLTGSLKGTALEGQGTRDIFEAVGVAATVMNLSAEQSEGAFLALSQMASKGKVQAEELRGQLGEHIPGALKIAADAMGVSQQQFNEMLDSGQVYAEDFLPKFAKQLKTTFEGGLPKAANSMQAAINRKNNALLSFKIKAGEAFRPLITGVLDAGATLFGFASDLMSHLEPVKSALQGVVQAFLPFVNIVKHSFASFSQFTEGGSMAETVMNGIANAIQNVMPLFTFLGKVLAFSYENTMRVVSSLWQAIEGLFEGGTAGIFLTNVINALVWVWDLLSPAISEATGIIVVAIGVIGGVVKVVMEAVNALFEWGKKTEWVQRVLNAFVSFATAAFKAVGGVAKSVLGAVGDLIIGVFTLDIDKIKSALGKGFDAIKGAVSLPKKTIEGAVDGWNKKIEKPITKKLKVTSENLTPENKPTDLSPIGNIPKPKGSGAMIPTSGGKPNNRVSAGGSGDGNKHTVFNIQSFVKELTIQTTNLKENPRELKKLIEQIFNEAFADIQIRVNNA
ncbi:tape measure protein [Riemerella anatipestifer]|uniref:tape measure protein n=1 Tax=Riemerella anatipestifer TaxID=34085 RepID=UPI003DAA0D7E